jgi:hypothetical protein
MRPSPLSYIQAALLVAMQGCSAPEVVPPGPTPSPRELRGDPPAGNGPIARAPNAQKKGSVEPTEGSLKLIPLADASGNGGSTPLQDSSEADLAPQDEAMLRPPLPPYTGWTTKPSTSLLGPGGREIFSIERSGTRVEVKKIEGGIAMVVCSGCAPPRQNHGGFLPAETIGVPLTIDPNSPLKAALSLRNDWARGQQLPEGWSSKRDLCMLVDHGFSRAAGRAVWENAGGKVVLVQTDEEWELEEASPPQSPAESTWRCAIEYNTQDG